MKCLLASVIRMLYTCARLCTAEGIQAHARGLLHDCDMIRITTHRLGES